MSKNHERSGGMDIYVRSDVIIDDFGPNGIDINHLLRWFDRYKCLVENKGVW